MNESLAQRRRRLCHPRDHGTDCNLRIINANQRLLHLQRPMLACLGVDMIPIIKTECYVAVLLDFKNHDVLQGVDGARTHQDRVTGLWCEAGQVVLDFPVCNGAAKIICGRAGRQSSVDTAFGIRFQDYPCLGLACLPRWN